MDAVARNIFASMMRASHRQSSRLRSATTMQDFEMAADRRILTSVPRCREILLCI
jgi:hypothetical protein